MPAQVSKQSEVIQTAVSDNKFVHDPLDLAQPSIRVIRIQKDSRKKDIRCGLKHIMVENDQYVCLSYMWGSPEPTSTIYINDKPFQVRQNLYEFLVKARKFRKQEWLWIDAICIDQDNNNERGDQVRLMAQIYSRAKYVLVYPGRVSRAVNVVYHIVQGTRWLRTSRSAIASRFLRTLRIILCFTPLLFMAMLDEMLRPLYEKGLENFHNMEYWKRVWIIQELMLSKGFYLVSKFGTLRIDNGLRGWKIAKPGTFLNNVLSRRVPTSELAKDVRLGELLRAFSESKSSIDVDRIYALLGLVKIPERFKIDYERSIHATVFHVIEHFSRLQTNSLSGLFIHAVFTTLDYWPAVLCCQCSYLLLERNTSILLPHSCEPSHLQDPHFLRLVFLGKKSNDRRKVESLLDTFTAFNLGSDTTRWSDLPNCDSCGQCLEHSFTQRHTSMPNIRWSFARANADRLVLEFRIENTFASPAENIAKTV